MGANSAIEWTDHTFNPWWGCIRVSPGCEHCYAETFSNRLGLALWGPAATTERRVYGEKHWNEPLKWNRDAERHRVRKRVFCASMADVFEDHPRAEQQRPLLWETIEQTPWLDWQLLTKRPENINRMVPWGDAWPANVWIGTSVENQEMADKRIPILLRVPAKVRFLSMEPLLGPVDLERYLWKQSPDGFNFFTGERAETMYEATRLLHWLICGGESGPHARPMHPDWARSLRDQCQDAGVPFFMKQLGSVQARETGLRDKKGGDLAEWPADLRFREMPNARSH